MNVLVVDDSAIMRAIVLKTLAMSGVAIGGAWEAANGAEALDLLQRHQIDLVMLDISMPVMRGDEMLERMRCIPAFRELPVIVVSSERSEERVSRMEAMGAAFVRKPFAPEEVRTVILSLMARNELAPR